LVKSARPFDGVRFFLNFYGQMGKTNIYAAVLRSFDWMRTFFARSPGRRTAIGRAFLCVFFPFPANACMRIVGSGSPGNGRNQNTPHAAFAAFAGNNTAGCLFHQ
jgi:hypothetical protein